MAKRRGGGWWIVVAALLAAGVGAWYLYRARREPAGPRFELVTVELDRGSIRRTVDASGAVEALALVEVGSQLSGRIASLHADFNHRVRAGQLLARIDPQSFETGVREQEAQLEIAQASIRQQEASVGIARQELDLAARELQRGVQLRRDGTLTESQYDALVTAKRSAELRVEMTAAQLQNARAVAKQRAAALDQARVELERTYIRSPIDGVVIERAVNVGQTVAASLASPILFKIAEDLGEVRILTSVDEADIGHVQSGNPVTFTVDAHPDRVFEGTVEEVRLAATVLQNVVTYAVVVRAQNQAGLLLPGMTATVEVVTASRQDVLRVPNEALRFDPRSLAPRTIPGLPERRRRDGARPDAAAISSRLLTGLLEGLPPAQQQEVHHEVTALIERMRQDSPRLGGGDAFRALLRSRLEDQLARALAPGHGDDARAAAWREIGMLRYGVVWTPGADGGLMRRPVLLGVGDETHTEVVGGELEPKAKVATGVKALGAANGARGGRRSGGGGGGGGAPGGGAPNGAGGARGGGGR
ncbi:MAG: efflux RND transporter periplasmic adaptor subunit [Planctomycetota bacterium]